jgi:hypothetical protein
MSRMMRLRSIAIASSVSVLLLIDLLPSRLDFYPKNAVAISQQIQKTTINLRVADLKQSHIISVSPSQGLTQMTGDIKLNGKQIAKLSRNTTRINLGPSLKLGENIVVVSGQYSPASTSVNLKLISPSKQVSQQMAGSGYLKQILVIKVQ